jgi:hypothetical protein
MRPLGTLLKQTLTRLLQIIVVAVAVRWVDEPEPSANCLEHNKIMGDKRHRAATPLQCLGKRLWN